MFVLYYQSLTTWHVTRVKLWLGIRYIIDHSLLRMCRTVTRVLVGICYIMTHVLLGISYNVTNAPLAFVISWFTYYSVCVIRLLLCMCNIMTKVLLCMRYMYRIGLSAVRIYWLYVFVRARMPRTFCIYKDRKDTKQKEASLERSWRECLMGSHSSPIV